MGIKILHDIDTDGEVQGTSLDINGNADVSGNTVAGGQLTLDQDQITTNIGTTSAISLRPGATTNTTGKSSIFLGTSTDDNYGISLKGARLGTNGVPTFEIGTHSNSANGASTFVLDAETLTLDTNMGTAGNFSGAQFRIDSRNTADNTGFQGIRFATSTTANYGWSMGANRSSSGRGSIRFYEHINSDTGLERFTILQAGNVGIGTASPAVKLEIAAATGGVMRLTSTDTTVQAGESIGKIEFKSSDASTGGDNVMGFINSVATNVGTTYALSFGTGNGDAAVERMRVDNLGNVGIGTDAPDVLMHIGKGNVNRETLIKLEADYNSDGASVGGIEWADLSNVTGNISTRYDGSKVSMYFGSLYNSGYNSTERMVIQGDGNVGIGVVAPASTLHVAGTVQVGVDDTGHDVIFYGATSGKKMQWDQSADTLIVDGVLDINGEANISDHLVVKGTTATPLSGLFAGSLVVQGGNDEDPLIAVTDVNEANAAAGVFHQSSASPGFPALVINAHSNGNEQPLISARTNVNNSTGLGGTEVFAVDGDGDATFAGKVGINETSIDAKLHISDSTTPNIKFERPGAKKWTIGISGTDFIIDDVNDDLSTHVLKLAADNNATFAGNLTFGDSHFIGDDSDDNLLIQGSASENIIIDSADDIILDADGGDVIFRDGGTEFGRITNSSGNLVIKTNLDDGDIIFQSDDGSGGIEAYVTVDGGVGRTYFHKHLNMVDDAKVMVGTGSDLQIYHDGSNSFVKQLTGNLTFEQNSDDGDIIFKSDDGAGGVATYFSLDGSAATHDGSATTALHTVFPDKSYINLGTGSDFQMHHNGVDTILGNQTGDLKIRQFANDKDIVFECDDGSGGVETYLIMDGSASSGNPVMYMLDGGFMGFGNAADLNLSHDGTNSLITNNTGSLTITNNSDNADILFQSDNGSGGVATYFYLDGSLVDGSATLGATRFPDKSKILIGTGGDLQIYHDGSNTYMQNATGTFHIDQMVDDGDLALRCDDGSGGHTAYLTLDGGLGYTTAQKHIRFNDSVQALFGTGADLKIYHDSNFSRIDADGTGDLIITQKTADKDIIFSSDDGSGGETAYLTLDGSAGTSIFSTDVTFNGDITIDNSSGDPFLKLATAAQEYVIRIDQSDSEKFQIRDTTAGVTALSIDTSQNATFAGTLTSGSFVANGETLTIGDDDNGIASITRLAHSDDAGGRLSIQSGNATGTNKVGGDMMISAGLGTGSGAGGEIQFYSSAAGGSGTTLRSSVEIAVIDNVGNLQIDGDLTVSGNDIKDSGGNSIISSDGSGVVTMATGNILIGGSNANVTMNAGSDIILEADNAGGGFASSIQYLDAAGGNKIMLGADSGVVVLANRAANGTVQIRANTSTAGSGGETTVVTVEDTKVDIAKDLNVAGIVTGKQKQAYNNNFVDDLSTTKHYIPFQSQSEQTTIYQEEAASLMPCDGRIVSVTVRVSSVTGSGDMTIGVNTIAPNGNPFSTGNWTEEETEVLAVASTDDYHVFHFAFSNDKHFDSGDLLAISIQNSADLSANQFWYATTVVEYDWNTFLGGTSAEFDSNP